MSNTITFRTYKDIYSSREKYITEVYVNDIFSRVTATGGTRTAAEQDARKKLRELGKGKGRRWLVHSRIICR